MRLMYHSGGELPKGFYMVKHLTMGTAAVADVCGHMRLTRTIPWNPTRWHEPVAMRRDSDGLTYKCHVRELRDGSFVAMSWYRAGEQGSEVVSDHDFSILWTPASGDLLETDESPVPDDSAVAFGWRLYHDGGSRSFLLAEPTATGYRSYSQNGCQVADHDGPMPSMDEKMADGRGEEFRVCLVKRADGGVVAAVKDIGSISRRFAVGAYASVAEFWEKWSPC